VKRLFLGLMVAMLMASASMASVGVGVKNILANGTGVDLVVGTSTGTYTVGGIYTNANDYMLTGSAVFPVVTGGNGLGVDVIYNGVSQTFVSNLILEKVVPVSSGLSLVFDMNLISYSSATQTTAGLTGGSIGFRTAIM
jgi:hypothetical protein